MNVSELSKNKPATMAVILDNVPALQSTTTCHETAELFRRLAGATGFAVLQDGYPIGLIGRDDLTIKLATQFGHAVYGKRSVAELMFKEPLIVEISETIDTVEHMITTGYETALTAGFIITDNGQYVGMGNALA
ncbi:hypothetical protein [Sneathiella glossodoripedis]|uniref:hypothetical protein n=1 Tax=Sneathiella glossodoripedis TaxID=418853 RepID=UPI0011DCB481|nr:hypothetical protein [Sneathiella glossodoripedis]